MSVAARSTKKCRADNLLSLRISAGYTNLSKNEDVISDCTSALRLDPTYVKALNRRGQAREAVGGEEELFQALCGMAQPAFPF